MRSGVEKFAAVLIQRAPVQADWVATLPLLRCCFERADHLDVVRLLRKRQDIAAILGDPFASN